jgi:hypothetical protein
MSLLGALSEKKRYALLICAFLGVGFAGTVLWLVARPKGTERLNIFAAISAGDIAAVREILAQDAATANSISEGGQTPLSFAAWCFWGPGGNKWPRKNPPAEKHTRLDCAEIAQVLIDNGAHVDARNASGKTALQIAALSGNLPVANVLIGGGADVNARGESGDTPLHWAAGTMRKEIVDLLLKNGANPNLKTPNGETALDWVAARAGFGKLEPSEQAEYDEIVEMLKRYTTTWDETRLNMRDCSTVCVRALLHTM